MFIHFVKSRRSSHPAQSANHQSSTVDPSVPLQGSDSRLDVSDENRSRIPPSSLNLGTSRSSCSDSKLALDYFQSVDEITDPLSEESESKVTQRSRPPLLSTASAPTEGSFEDETIGLKKVRQRYICIK